MLKPLGFNHQQIFQCFLETVKMTTLTGIFFLLADDGQ